MPSKQDLLGRMNPYFFLDYIQFSGLIRDYASRTLEDAYKADPNPIRWRYHLVNLIKEEYSAYEDLARMLFAFLSFSTKSKCPLEILFKNNADVLENVFTSFHIQSADALLNKLEIISWIPNEWATWFPHLDIKKALQLSGKFWFEDCLKNQKKFGIRAYNKVKHGLLVVPNGKDYVRGTPNGPAMLIEGLDGTPTLYTFKDNAKTAGERHRMIYFIQCNLRLLAALYISKFHQDILPGQGFNTIQLFFKSDAMYDIRHFIGEITAKK